MAKSSRRRNRNRVRPATPPSQRQGNGPPPARPFIDLEKRLDSIELPLLNVGPDVVPDPDSGSTPPPETPTGGSRANSLKNALRSRVLFPIEMKELIDRLFRDFARDLKPVGSLSEWLVYELARSKLQADLACDRLTVDEGRIVERAGTSFDSDQTVRANTLGARLSKQPQLVSGALEATKFGTLYLVKQYEFLEDIVRSNRCLNDQQLDVLGDLLGIDHVYRPGCGRIPAGTDAQALTSLIARELGRLRGNLPALCARSDAEKGMAMLGIVSAHDSTTRILRADRSRARGRFNWAMKTLKEIQKGANPADIIDPDTRRPLAAGPTPTAVPDRAQPTAAATAPPPPAPPQSTPPAPEAAPAAAPTIAPLPEGLSEEAREMFLITAGAILNQRTPPTAGVPGPLPTA